MLKLGKETRFYCSLKPEPRLLAEEGILFSKEDVWLYESRCTPWRVDIGMPVPFLVKISFHITEQRTSVIVQHQGMLNIEMSQWFPGTSAAIATEFIRDVAVHEQHFGMVKFDFLGLGGGRFGIGRTPFDKTGGEVPYLEIVSGLPGASHCRTTKIFMGIGKEAEKELESAHSVLLDKL